MNNLDIKLGDWFKQVEKQEKELRTKKTVHPDEEEVQKDNEETEVTAFVETKETEAFADAEAEKEDDSSIATMHNKTIDEIEKTYQETTEDQSNIEGVGTETIVSGTEEAPEKGFREVEIEDDVCGIVGEPRAIAEDETTAEARPLLETEESVKEDSALFDDEEIPQVEDFLSFIAKEEEKEDEDKDDDFDFDPKEQCTLLGVEGTGEPRPIKIDDLPSEDEKNDGDVSFAAREAKRIEREVFREKEKQSSQKEEATAIDDEEPASHIEYPVVKAKAPVEDGIQQKWDRMPHHLQVLFGTEEDEVAQNSYKRFKETRGELVARLMDPTLTLEETARILNVCPTTVRRYTNKGLLQHFRTAGNQRRFKLSDVLNFMESTFTKGTGQSES